MSEQAHCSSCGAPIRWAKTASGKSMPLDAEPCELGSMILMPSGVVMVVTPNYGDKSLKRYRSHFASCPNSAAHRKKHAKPAKSRP